MPSFFPQTGDEPLKIAVFTSTRADSGILAPVARALAAMEDVEVHALATGTHLNGQFGHTLEQELSEWGPLEIHEIPLGQEFLTEIETAKSLGVFQVHLAETLASINPDSAVVLGDRTEALAFAFSCSILGIPLIHLHGGEISMGALDDNHRHAISKLSSLHFTSSEEASKRLQLMGENPTSISYFGSIASDRIPHQPIFTKAKLAKQFGFSWGEKTAVVTMHGAKFDNPSTAAHLSALLTAVDRVEGLNVVFTGPNADPESQQLRAMIVDYCKLHQSKAFFVESFGSQGYLDMLVHSDIAIGNSSSLIHEAPLVGVPAVLVGSRQDGREGKDKTGTGADPKEIGNLISQKLSGPRPAKQTQPGSGSVATLIAKTIYAKSPIGLQKGFWTE